MKDLTKRENWTEEMIYIHKSRLLIGMIFGIVIGICIVGISLAIALRYFSH